MPKVNDLVNETTGKEFNNFQMAKSKLTSTW